ncbi:MAG: hypothetical protein ACI8QZ_002762 [Chlamydiales bacterium]|jgi:hypothetical protein
MSASPRSSREKATRIVLLLAASWVAAGALFKLFAGSPNDLPPLVRDFVLGPVQTFRSAIAIELCIVILALLRPRFAWLPLVGLFGVFIGVLIPLATSGADSCGCFGSAVAIPPAVMIAIDGSLLTLILAMRPWSAFPSKGLRPLPLIPLFVIAVAVPWYKFRTLSTHTPVATRTTDTATPDTSDDPADATADATDTQTDTPPDEVDEYAPWALPDPLPDFHWFETDDWLDQEVHDIDLSLFLDPDLLPTDCEIVLYRQTCDHCKEHLEKLTMEPPMMPLVLLRVVEIGDTPENDIIVVKPTDHIPMELPAIPRGYGIETPMQVNLSGWIVTEVISLR